MLSEESEDFSGPDIWKTAESISTSSSPYWRSLYRGDCVEQGHKAELLECQVNKSWNLNL